MRLFAPLPEPARVPAPVAIAVWLFLACAAGPASAQPVEQSAPEQVGVIHTEEPDPTRLDVKRLPPEAAPVTRDLYARGLYVEGLFGARGFVGDLGKVSKPGPMLALGLGYELTNWFALGVGLAGSLHVTDNRPPPSKTAFEAIEGYGVLRFMAPLSARAALRLDGEGGFIKTTGDVLHALGFVGSQRYGGVLGGSLGFDWHARNRHHSFGLVAGSRWLPLYRDSISVHGAGYIHYVF